MANQVQPRSAGEALVEIVAVEPFGAGAGDQGSMRGIGADERLIDAADPLQDDELGRGSPGGTTARIAAGARRLVNRRLGTRRRGVSPFGSLKRSRAWDFLRHGRTRQSRTTQRLRVHTATKTSENPPVSLLVRFDACHRGAAWKLVSTQESFSHRHLHNLLRETEKMGSAGGS